MGLIAQHVPARADGCPGCPGWWDRQMDWHRSIWSIRQESIRGESGSVWSGSGRKSVRSGCSPDRLLRKQNELGRHSRNGQNITREILKEVNDGINRLGII
jgi:hypothetical protein